MTSYVKGRHIVSEKFDSPLAERLYELSLDGLWHDDEASAGDGNGWACLFTNLITNACTFVVHAILREDSQGFVTCETFDSGEEAEEGWEGVREVYDEAVADADCLYPPGFHKPM